MSKNGLEKLRVLVAGGGSSGRAAARFLLGRAGEIVLADDKPKESLAPETLALESEGIVITGGGLERAGKYFGLCVLSPGISVYDARIQALAESGVEVISEVELASRYLSAPIIGITGTNGKTTVTKLLGHILKSAGKRVFVGGNVGTPLIEAVGGNYEVVVAELSSFQLEACREFHPAVSVFLNLKGDHLERHKDLREYGDAKARIFMNQTGADAAVVNRDDPLVWEYAKSSGATIIPYSVKGPLGVGGWKEGEEAVILMPGNDGVRLPLSCLKLRGLHNVENVLAAVLAAAIAGVAPAEAWESACEFKGLPHRIEEFLKWRGITFIDDSKATNVDAVVRAMETVKTPLILLMGGIDKGSDYAPIRAGLAGKGKKVIVAGPHGQRMAKELEGAVPLTTAKDWPEAVRLAVGSAGEGDTILLSPAAASFDFFTGYAQRGEVFQKLCLEETRRMGDG